MATRSNDFDNRIKEDLKKLAEERKSGPKPKCTMFQVVPWLRNVNPEHYIPVEISLGLFNRSALDAPKTRADKCRLAIAGAFLELVGTKEGVEDDWDNLCKLVVPNPKETQDLYDEIGRDPLSLKDAQSVLTLDAIFLAVFLSSGNVVDNPTFMIEQYFPAFKGPLALIARHSGGSIMRDILQVENQIPLSLIQNALRILFDRVDEEAPPELRVGHGSVLQLICGRVALLQAAVMPGYDDDARFSSKERVSYNFSEYYNLLDFAYRWQLRDELGWTSRSSGSAGVSMLPNRNPLDNLSSFPSVAQLRLAGIEFRGCKGSFQNVKFSPGLFNAVLHLPTLYIDGGTEGLWRNLAAYEQMMCIGGAKELNQCCQFLCYLNFMDSLIDDDKDVMLLTEGKFPVIFINLLGTNKEVARLFNNVTEGFTLYPSQEWVGLKKEIKDYYNKISRRMYVEFMETNFGKPWVIISVLAVVILFLASLLQTVFTILGYYYR